MLESEPISRAASAYLSSPRAARQARLAMQDRPKPFERSWETWVHAVFPDRFKHDFSSAHRETWDWGWSITKDYAPAPRCVVLARGHGKTSTADAIDVSLLCRKARRFLFILGGNMDKSRSRVNAIRQMIESPRFRWLYPGVGEPLVGGFGKPVSWNRDMIITADGCVVRAGSVGSDPRGWLVEALKEALRPDFYHFDDVDARQDSEAVTTAKELRLKVDVLPGAGDEPAPILFTQTLTKMLGVMDRLYRRESDWLPDRVMIGPLPAVEGIKIDTREDEVVEDGMTVVVRRHKITRGTATWAGRPIERCQEDLDLWGKNAFEWECQHKVTDFPGALLTSDDFLWTLPDFKLNAITRRVVGVDPAVGQGTHGIVCVGIGPKRQLYGLEDASVGSERRKPDDVALVEAGRRSDPLTYRVLPGDGWAACAILCAARWCASLRVEANQGGESIMGSLRTAQEALLKSGRIARRYEIKPVWASTDKKTRARPIAQFHIDGDFRYLSSTWEPTLQLKHQPHPAALLTHPSALALRRRSWTKLHGLWTTWTPDAPHSPDEIDAEVWAAETLRPSIGSTPKATSRGPGGVVA